jgi:hypothetical protein
MNLGVNKVKMYTVDIRGIGLTGFNWIRRVSRVGIWANADVSFVWNSLVKRVSCLCKWGGIATKNSCHLFIKFQSVLCQLGFRCLSATFQLRIISTPSPNELRISPILPSYQLNTSPISTLSHLRCSSFRLQITSVSALSQLHVSSIPSPNQLCTSSTSAPYQLRTISNATPYQPHAIYIWAPYLIQISSVSVPRQLHIRSTPSQNVSASCEPHNISKSPLY